MLPAAQPAMKAAIRPSMGWPLTQSMAEKAAPKVKLLSTVRSGMFSVLKEMKTPRAIIAYIIPSSKEPLNIKNREVNNVIIYIPFELFPYKYGLGQLKLSTHQTHLNPCSKVYRCELNQSIINRSGHA